MAFSEVKTSVLLEKVYDLIRTKVSPEQSLQVERLAKIVFKNVEQEDLAFRDDQDLYGAILSLWNQLSSIHSDASSVKVFNPEQKKHGWQSTHTIIQVVHPDMSFVVDSIELLLQRLNFIVHFVRNSPIQIQRDSSHRILNISYISGASQDKNDDVAMIYIEINRLATDKLCKELERKIKDVLQDVSRVVDAWPKMLDSLQKSIDDLSAAAIENSSAQKEAIAFLKYLYQNRFTFLGFCRYDLKKVGDDLHFVSQSQKSLGLFKSHEELTGSINLSDFATPARKEALNDAPLILTKSSLKSQVHRYEYIDYIGIKRFNKKGEVIGEDCFLGLYALSFYHSNTKDIPLLKNKVERIMKKSGLLPRSHDYRQLSHILETYPRDELLQASEKELSDAAQGILQIKDRDKLKVIVRHDHFGRYISCMVYISKERFNTKLRHGTQAFLADYFKSQHDVEFMTYFTQSTLARTHYIVKVDDYNVDIDVKEIENNLKEATRLWEDKFNHALISHFGEARGREISDCYGSGFPRSYQEEVNANTAVYDIEQLEALDDSKSLGILFYKPQEADVDSGQVRLKLYSKNTSMTLSDVLPMLENFGLRVITEHPYEVKSKKGVFWISDFLMMMSNVDSEDLMRRQELFQDALFRVWKKDLEDDGFNRLVLNIGASGHETCIIRAYAKYMRQIESTFSQSYIIETMSKHGECAQLLIEMFERKFNPDLKDRSLTQLADKIEVLLDDVTSLDDDRIIRRYLDLIYATLRTNFYQKNEQGGEKAYISLKFSPELIPEMPLPLPKFEIFVYSIRFEGVHLRGGKVARGGLRWSDRKQDFRTEVLGLVKAQQVKNTVIVPVGAKGGFVCKQMPDNGAREEVMREGQECYKLFIRALLDITDNVIQGETIPPKRVVCHDDEDTYLVVAADKGTATFSDIANGISEEYNFWLGDAFASGGSHGYDHKKMGITARGAWESVKRHFKEFGIDSQTTDFTCIGVGDMAGDVFGNGMLLSKHICLQAAFNHMHIFIDPKPDSASSWDERYRLFTTPGTSWTDYNKSLISEGGGVFLRSAKSIQLTPEIQEMIGTTEESITPNILIQHILRMKVDLMWNGGIGTYVKSSKETHLDVGDRANDAVRANANELQVKVIGEGGNLGCTQLGRIEFDMHNSGRVNTDFIDNVGGVDCSDNEVNIKILLNSIVTSGDLTLKQRNTLLEDMTDEVSEIVLKDCRDQTQAISISESFGVSQLKEQIRFIHHLEKEGKLDRVLEFLPPDEELAERIAAGRSLTRPELSVLFSYAKMVLKEQFNTPEVTQDPYLVEHLLVQYFPKRLQDSYRQQIQEHALSEEIIATALANQIVNDMGMNFVYRMHDETGSSIAEIGICYLIARNIFFVPEFLDTISDPSSQVPSELLYEILYKLRRNTRRACYWLARNRDRKLQISETINKYRSTFHALKKDITRWLMDEEVNSTAELVYKYEQAGISQEVAFTLANMGRLFSSLDITEIALDSKKPILRVAELYFKLRAKCQLYWFLEQINAQSVSNHWQALARAAFREDLDSCQRQLTSKALSILNDASDVDDILEQWFDEHHLDLSRWFNRLADFKISSTHEFAKFSVLFRELRALVLKMEHQV
mgnify:CR=1 FL=1